MFEKQREHRTPLDGARSIRRAASGRSLTLRFANDPAKCTPWCRSTSRTRMRRR